MRGNARSCRISRVYQPGLVSAADRGRGRPSYFGGKPPRSRGPARSSAGRHLPAPGCPPGGGQAGGAVPAVIPALDCASMPVCWGVRSRRSWPPPRAVRRCRGSPGVRAAQRFSLPTPAIPRPWALPAAGQGECLAGTLRPKSCAAPNGSGRASKRSRNTMRVKPYAIRFPPGTRAIRDSRRQAAVCRRPGAPAGTAQAAGPSGGPGGTSCTGQYRYPASGQRNGFPKSPATRHRPAAMSALRPSSDGPVRVTDPRTTLQPEPPPGSTRIPPDCRLPAERQPGCSRRRLDAGQPALMPK